MKLSTRLQVYSTLVLLMSLFSCCSESSQLQSMESEDKKSSAAETTGPSSSGFIRDQVAFHPKEYEEGIVDSVLNQSANLRLVIKNYTLMDQGIDTVYVYHNGSKERIHFRHTAVDVSLTLEDSLIYSNTFIKEKLPGIDIKDEFGRASILSGIWLSDYNHQQGIITLLCNVCVPDTDWCNFYKIYIDKEGKQSIVLVEQT